MPKGILFVAPNSWVVRNWLATGLADLCAEELDPQIAFASSFEDPSFSSPAGRVFPNHFVPSHRIGKIEAPAGYSRFLYLMYYLRLRRFALDVEHGSIQMMILSRRRDAIHYCMKIFGMLAPLKSRRRGFIRSLVDKINPRNAAVGAVLDESRPRCVVVGSPGFQFLDQAFIIEAHRRSIPVHCIVSSWDNMTSRGAMVRRPETLMVWNEFMKMQAEEIHDYPAVNTFVVGSLQFTKYDEPVSDEEIRSLYERLGLPAGSDYLLFLTGQHVPEYEAADVARLLAALTGTRFGRLPLVVRVHPQADLRPFDALDDPRLVLDRPPRFSAGGGGGRQFDSSEIRAMAALLSRGTIVFSSWGTTALLEAAIFDRPIVQLRWMDAFPRDRTQAARVHDFQRYTHLVPFDATGCRIFNDHPERLAEDLHRLEAEQERLREARAEAVRRLAGPPFAQVPSRIVERLKEALGSSHARTR
jgi:hypothetical protein